MLNNKPLSVGFVGIGDQAWDNLIPSVAGIKNINIKGVCDIDKDKSKLAARNYGASAYSDFKEMLKSEELDAVIVASHPQVHLEVLNYTIPRSIPVFVEKPPTLSTTELKKIVKLNEKYQTLTSVGLNFNYADPVKFLIETIKKPEFGNLQYLQVCHFGSKPNGTLWGLKSKIRTFLLAQAIHPLGLIFYLGNAIPSETKINKFVNEKGLLFNVNMLMEDNYKNKFSVDLLTTSMAPFFEWKLHLISNLGVMININSLWEVEMYSHTINNSLIDNSKWWRETWRPSPLSGGFKRTGYEHQFEEFFNNIRTKQLCMNSIERMLPIYELMDKMENNDES